MSDAPLLAALYLRQSKGKQRSITEQETDGQARCGSEGWRVHGVYQDTTSASRFARTGRPDWERLLGDLGARQFGVLWIWESSRGDRDAETWLGLLRRCAADDVRIYVETHERLYDVANDRDWRTLADEGIDSDYESRKTSRRVRRDLKANAVKGRPHGVTLYGYERIYDSRTRVLLEQRPHPQQAPIVVEVFTRHASGEPLSRIEADLWSRGILSNRGKRLGRASLRQMLTNPAYIGKRRAGSTQENRTSTELYDAIWPPLVDEVTYWKVQRRLSDAKQQATRPGRQKWLLSYWATCGECGAHFSVFPARRLYGCSEKGCTYISMAALDRHVAEQLFAFAPDIEAAAQASRNDDRAIMAARAHVDELTVRLDELARMAARGEISPRALGVAEAELLPAIKAAQQKAASVAARPGGGYLPVSVGLAEEWETLPVLRRRELIQAMVTSISVRKPTRRGEPCAERVTLRWVWEDAQKPPGRSPKGTAGRLVSAV